MHFHEHIFEKLRFRKTAEQCECNDILLPFHMKTERYERGPRLHSSP